MKVFLADLVHSYVPAVGGIYPSGNESGFVVPYGIASIAAYAKKVFGDTLDVSLFKFPNDLLQACDNCEDSPPDVIGFSNYVWNNHLNFTIGTKIRERFPNALFVAGGPSVQEDQNGIEGYLQKNRFIDICILHEGERPFAAILAEFKKSGKAFIAESRPIMSSGFLSSSGQLVYTKNTKFEELDPLPSPYVEKYLDYFMSRGFVPLFETNRGCPFACSYCAWGIAALSKVRKFPMDRIYSEFDYVADKMPSAPTWFIADANFGILQRDLEIAQRICDIKTKNQALKTIVIYESKNTPTRNLEVAKLLRNQFGGKVHRMDNALIALQTLDPVAQAASNRSNIKLGDVAEKVDLYHADGYGVRTDILSGLPGETHEAHLESLRKVFTFNFDHIGIYNVVLLPGTDMASQKSRETHQIFTKVFTRDGFFGEYNGIKSLEAEEVIYGNSAITPDDLLSLRLLHWAIWFGWNHKFLKPLLRYSLVVQKKNPVDVLYSLVKGEANSNPDVRAFFDSLRSEYAKEFFESPDSLREHYLQENNWNLLKGGKQKPAQLMHNAKMIRDQSLFKSVLVALQDIIAPPGTDSTDCEEICRILMLMRIEPADIYAGEVKTSISLSIPSHLIRFFSEVMMELNEEMCDLVLQKPIKDQENIRNSLIAKSYSDDPLAAICSTIGPIQNAFTYDLVAAKGNANFVNSGYQSQLNEILRLDKI